MPVTFAGYAVTHHRLKLPTFTISDSSAPAAKGVQGMGQAGTASQLGVGKPSVLQAAGNV